jgi:hypothetical protein
MKFALCALLFCGGAASDADGPPLTYRMASYSIGYRVTRASLAEAFDSSMKWEYPVVTPVQTPANHRLNVWLREESLNGFKLCFPVNDDLRATTDRKLVTTLSTDAGFAACEWQQSVIHPRGAFGRYATFERVTEWTGSTRPQHGIEILTFDMTAGVAVDIAKLFKPGALEALNRALAEQIANDTSRPECRGRSFDWFQVSPRPPAELSVEFPFNPAEWRDCGDSGVEMLSGRVVSQQMLNPRNLRPARSWVEERR